MMKKIAQTIACLLLLSTVTAQIVNNKKLYLIKSYGNDKMNVRMFSDYKMVDEKLEFHIVFCFQLRQGWYTYSDTPSDLHRPLSINLELPVGFEIINKYRDLCIQKDGVNTEIKQEIYDKSFCIIYRIRTPEKWENRFDIRAKIGWQCCNEMICTIEDVEPVLTLNGGDVKKSNLYEAIQKKLKMVQK
ncbi:MAG: protein-disulfide reductase DsbD family protein [Odoribacter sp.]